MALDYGNSWCADSDGSGGMSNWSQLGYGSTCGQSWVMTDNASWFRLMALAEAGASGGGTSTPSQTFTTEEVQALKYQAANPSPFNLSMSDGAQIAGAIAVIWSIAWVLKALVRSLNTDGEKE